MEKGQKQPEKVNLAIVGSLEQQASELFIYGKIKASSDVAINDKRERGKATPEENKAAIDRVIKTLKKRKLYP